MSCSGKCEVATTKNSYWSHIFHMSCNVFMYLCIHLSGFQHLLSYFIVLKSGALPQSVECPGRLMSVEISCQSYLYTVIHGEDRLSAASSERRGQRKG